MKKYKIVKLIERKKSLPPGYGKLESERAKLKIKFILINKHN